VARPKKRKAQIKKPCSWAFALGSQALGSSPALGKTQRYKNQRLGGKALASIKPPMPAAIASEPHGLNSSAQWRPFKA
jgi:hypothetical protein